MRIPPSLETLADHGIIQQVLRPLMSGKEAQIYLVISEGRPCAAKIYKDAQNRSFKNRADYVEGRKVRNSRDQRAMNKGTRYGKSRDEDTWKCTEVEMIYRLQREGVRVPRPHTFVDGVLVMDLIVDESGEPAPRLGDLHFSPDEASRIYQLLLDEVAAMLRAGVVHGDLSEFNVLLAADGPVIIDFPQAVEAAGNRSARALLIRDVENLHRFYTRWVPGARRRPYAEELWSLYERNQLTPETVLTGRFVGAQGPVDTRAVLELIGDANRDEARRRQASGQSTGGLEVPAGRPAPRRREVVVTPTPKRGGRRPHAGAGQHGGSGRSGGPDRPGRVAQPGGPGQRPASGHRSPAEQHRSSDASPGHSSRGADRGRSSKPTRPKRGDGVQASTYVSPEARKNKGAALKLTPHDPPGEDKTRRDRGSANRPAETEPSSEPGKRRRRRRRR